MEELFVLPIEKSQTPQCQTLLVQAYSLNPLYQAILGRGSPGLRRNDRFMAMAATAMRSETLVATSHGRLLGLLHFTPYPQCSPWRWRTVCLAPRLVLAAGLATPRVLAWRAAWEQVHPREAHSHLGPVAVLPEFQGRGIGKKLVEYYCALLDRSGEASYLETDKPENVTLYSRFGFEVIKERFVLGIRNWFMWRPATCRQPSVPTTASPD